MKSDLYPIMTLSARGGGGGGGGVWLEIYW